MLGENCAVCYSSRNKERVIYIYIYYIYLKGLVFHLNSWLTFLVFFRLSQLNSFLSPHIPGCFVFVCIFHIWNPACCSVFKSHHSLFVSLTQTFLFFPRDVYFWQRHPLSLQSNAPESSPCFLPDFSLFSASRPSNDTFCHSKVVSISPPRPPPAFLCYFFFKNIDLKGLEQVKKYVDWILSRDSNQRVILGSVVYGRFQVAAHKRWWRPHFFFFLNKYVFPHKSTLTCFSYCKPPIH